MKISIHAPYAKEHFETTRQHTILHPEGIVGNLEVDLEECRGTASITVANQFSGSTRLVVGFSPETNVAKSSGSDDRFHTIMGD